jgi:predicted ester cyclase
MSDLTSKNKDLMRRIYEEMWNRGNPVLAAEIFERPEGVERFVREFLRSFPDLQHRFETCITEGDIAVARFSAQGTHTGPWLGFQPTGKAIRYTGLTWARIANGKILEHHTEWDKAGLIDQLRRSLS